MATDGDRQAEVKGLDYAVPEGVAAELDAGENRTDRNAIILLSVPAIAVIALCVGLDPVFGLAMLAAFPAMILACVGAVVNRRRPRIGLWIFAAVLNGFCAWVLIMHFI
jgi:hypothetical protein